MTLLWSGGSWSRGMLTVGLTAGLLALCLPGGMAVRRRGSDGRWARRAVDFFRRQR